VSLPAESISINSQPRGPILRIERRRTLRLAKRSAYLLLALFFALPHVTHGQSAQTTNGDTEMAGTSTDFFVMMGSDFIRPGLEPKANYNIGIGHTFGFLKKGPDWR
jgi:hypothetical protein